VDSKNRDPVAVLVERGFLEPGPLEMISSSKRVPFAFWETIKMEGWNPSKYLLVRRTCPETIWALTMVDIVLIPLLTSDPPSVDVNRT
jgi:hypothetical protein